MVRCKRFVIAFDSHGDMADPNAINAFKEFVGWWKPDIKIHGGDAFDFRCLRNGASEAEKQEGLKVDVEHGVAFLKWFKPSVFLFGNHDYRLVNAAERARPATVKEYCRELLEQIKDSLPSTRIIQYGKRKGVYRLGNYRVVHGYHSGLYAARMASQVFSNVIMGHVHTPGYFESPHIDGATGYTSGCLCDLDMDYTLSQPNALRQAHGWIYGLLTPRGKTIPFASKVIDGQWYLPSEFKEVKHG